MAAGIRGTAPYGPAGTRPFRFGGVLGGPATGGQAADPTLAIGAIIDGRYEITGLVGEGGMGRVYAATHRFLGRRVALKVLHGDAQTSAESVARFRQEALLCTRIGHPGIVEVLDCATIGEGRRGRVFMVMELLEGESLEEAMDRPGPAAERLEWLAAISEALAAAHRVGVVHRDIKPANIFLVGGRAPKILDFGIAKAVDQEGVQTQAGALLGTPYYLAPERALGRALDGRTDLYSVGVILYELLTGDVPFVGATMMEVLGHQIHSAPLDPRQAAPERPIPATLATLTLDLLAKDPDARPADGDVLAARLRGLVAAEAEALAALTTGPRPQQEAPIAAPDSATLPPLDPADGAIAPADSATQHLGLPESAAAVAPADSATQRLAVDVEPSSGSPATQRLDVPFPAGATSPATQRLDVPLASTPSAEPAPAGPRRGILVAAVAAAAAVLLSLLWLRGPKPTPPGEPAAVGGAAGTAVPGAQTPTEPAAPPIAAATTPTGGTTDPADADEGTSTGAVEAPTPAPTKTKTSVTKKRTKKAPKPAQTAETPKTAPKANDGPTIKTDIYDD